MNEAYCMKIDSYIPDATRAANARVRRNDHPNDASYCSAWNNVYHSVMMDLTKHIRGKFP